MTEYERKLHKRLGKLKGRLLCLVAKIESMQILLGRLSMTARSPYEPELRSIPERVSLIDVDLKYREKKRRGEHFPNAALAKCSECWKRKGAITGLNLPNPDLTIISCVFTKNRLNAIKECCDTFDVNREFGGSGITMEWDLPQEIELMRPDYTLYNYQFSFGFTTRGCPNRCPFCIVPIKEGKFRRVQHIEEFHDARFKSCVLLDNNVLADVDWFFENTTWATKNKVSLKITQGMDIRRMTEEIAAQIKKTRFVDQQIRFAWDNMDEEDSVMAGIEMLKEAGINTRRNVSFYVLCGFNTTFEEDMYRVMKLRENRCHAFVMKYHDDNPKLNHLARWADKRELFWSTNPIGYKGGVIA